MKDQLERIEHKLDTALAKPLVEGRVTVCQSGMPCAMRLPVEYKKSAGVGAVVAFCQSSVPCFPERVLKIYERD